MSIQNFLSNEWYPKSAYNKDEALHFQVAHTPAKQLDWIQKQGAKFTCLDKHGLAPIHIAALKADRQMVEVFLKGGTPLDLKDQMGCNLLHHASLSQDKGFINWLKSLDVGNKLSRMVNDRGQTPQAYELILSRKPAQPEEQVIHYLDEKTNALVCANAKKFEEMTGAKYTSHILHTPVSLLKASREARSEGELLVEKHFKGCYEIYSKSPPKLYLGACSETKSWGVYTDQDVEAGRMIANYAGESRSFIAGEDDSYVLGNIDAKRVRNLGAMINDGFPNAAIATRIVLTSGELKICIVTLRKIFRGEQVLLDYESLHTVKQDHHVELNLRALEESFTKESLKNHMDFIKQLWRERITNANEKTSLNFLYGTSGYFYLINTPPSLIYLLAKGVISCEDCEKYLDLGTLSDNIKIIIIFMKECEAKMKKEGILNRFRQYIQSIAFTTCSQSLNHILFHIQRNATAQNWAMVIQEIEAAKPILDVIVRLQKKLSAKKDEAVIEEMQREMKKLPLTFALYVQQENSYKGWVMPAQEMGTNNEPFNMFLQLMSIMNPEHK